ncbi:MAG TPA: pyridoxamine 5'-phosphate oxidase family protein [Victivallales bacterium]|nr:pyridoxamine 5'-phosphate oxidase family protein [Victivallales bacterium]
MKYIQKIKSILAGQKFGVLATSDGRKPYQNIIAFAETADLKGVFFATPKQTSKYRNLKKNSNLSIFVDDRKNDERDIGNATGIAILGKSFEQKGIGRRKALARYLKKHPSLKEFAESPSNSIFLAKIEKIVAVNRFQNVVEIEP